jgi:hypothetical protein
MIVLQQALDERASRRDVVVGVTLEFVDDGKRAVGFTVAAAQWPMSVQRCLAFRKCRNSKQWSRSTKRIWRWRPVRTMAPIVLARTTPAGVPSKTLAQRPMARQTTGSTQQPQRHRRRRRSISISVTTNLLGYLLGNMQKVNGSFCVGCRVAKHKDIRFDASVPSPKTSNIKAHLLQHTKPLAEWRQTAVEGDSEETLKVEARLHRARSFCIVFELLDDEVTVGVIRCTRT